MDKKKIGLIAIINLLTIILLICIPLIMRYDKDGSNVQDNQIGGSPSTFGSSKIEYSKGVETKLVNNVSEQKISVEYKYVSDKFLEGVYVISSGNVVKDADVSYSCKYENTDIDCDTLNNSDKKLGKYYVIYNWKDMEQTRVIEVISKPIPFISISPSDTLSDFVNVTIEYPDNTIENKYYIDGVAHKYNGSFSVGKNSEIIAICTFENDLSCEEAKFLVKNVIVKKPTITSSTEPNELINSYAKKQVISVQFNNKDVSSPKYFIKSTNECDVNKSVISICGTGEFPSSCSKSSDKNIKSGYWYQVSGDLEITYSKASASDKIYAVGYDGVSYSKIEEKSLVNIDVDGPVIKFGKVNKSEEKIVLPITVLDDKSDVDDGLVCLYGLEKDKYDSEGKVTKSGNIYNCTMENLDISKSYYYKVCAKDKLGNETCKTSSLQTVDGVVKGTPSISVTWPNSNGMNLSLDGVSSVGKGVVEYQVKIGNEIKCDWKASSKCNVTGLEEGKPYLVTVSARNSANTKSVVSKTVTIYTSKVIAASTESKIGSCMNNNVKEIAATEIYNGAEITGFSSQLYNSSKVTSKITNGESCGKVVNLSLSYNGSTYSSTATSKCSMTSSSCSSGYSYSGCNVSSIHKSGCVSYYGCNIQYSSKCTVTSVSGCYKKSYVSSGCSTVVSLYDSSSLSKCISIVSYYYSQNSLVCVKTSNNSKSNCYTVSTSAVSSMITSCINRYGKTSVVYHECYVDVWDKSGCSNVSTSICMSYSFSSLGCSVYYDCYKDSYSSSGCSSYMCLSMKYWYTTDYSANIVYPEKCNISYSSMVITPKQSLY